MFFFFFAAASHQLMQPLSRPEPLAAKGTNLLHIVIRHTNTPPDYSWPFRIYDLRILRTLSVSDVGIVSFIVLVFSSFHNCYCAVSPSLISYCRSLEWL
ncbi:hypothetical protein V8C40DRAFT_13999 [Trichoderma camerunense]